MIVNPKIAKVIFKGRGSSVYFVLNDGTLDVNMPPDNYTITVEAKNHKPRIFKLQVGKDPMDDLRVALLPAWALLEVTSKAGARVEAISEDGERFDLGLVPDSGVLRVEEMLVTGNYQFVLSLTNYKSITTENLFLPLDELKEIEAALDPDPGILNILSQPPGATVLINGEVIGKTPIEQGDIPVGESIAVSITHEKYRPLEKQIELSPGEREAIDFGPMVLKTGPLHAQFALDGKASPPEMLNEIVIRIVGEKFTARDKFAENIIKGEHTLEVEHPNYKVWSELIKINDKRGTQVKVNLKSRPGVLTFDLDPPLPFTLLVDKRKVEVKNNVLNLRTDREYDLEIHVRDHLTVKRRMGFKPNEKQTWSSSLVPISGPEREKAWQVPYLGLNLSWIEAGSFKIGSLLTEQSRLPTEGPRTTMTISQGFWMAKYEVTQIQYLKVMEGKPSKFREPNHPVERVTWDQSMAFCQKITEQEQKAG